MYICGIMIYINENFSCRALNSNILQKEMETMKKSIEFSLKNWKWLCIRLYKLPIQNKSIVLNNLKEELTNLAVHHDN